MTGPNRSPWIRYGVALAAVGASVLLLAIPAIGPGLGGIVYVAVFVAAWYGGLGPGLVATAAVAGLNAATHLGRGTTPSPDRLASLAVFVASAVALILLVRAIDRSRLRAEEDAAEASRQGERLRTTLRSIGDAVIVTDDRGDIVSMNPVAEALTGYSEADAVGRRLVEVFRIANEETMAAVENPVERVLREGRVVGLANHTVLLARDGTIRPIDDSAAPIRGAPGTISGVVLVFRDVTARRAAEGRVEQAELRFRAFMDHAPMVAFLKDEEGRYLWGNAAWGRQFEGGTAASVGKTDLELWPEETARRFRASDLAALESGMTVEVIERSADPAGRVAHWMSMKFVLPDPSGRRGVAGVAVDVSRRIEAETAIRESESRYRMLFESNPHSMWVFDTATLAFLAVNEAATRRYGYTRDEFLRMKITEIRPPDDLPRLVAHVSRVATTPYHGETRWRHRKKDGTVIEVDIASHAIAFEGRKARLILAHDVTDRVRAEAALRISRERLDLVLEGAELGLWYCDLPTGKVVLNDRAMAHYAVEPAEEYSEETLLARLDPDDRRGTRAAMRLAIDEGRPFDVEFRVLRPDGQAGWVRAIGRAYRDGPGPPVRFDGISFDVTGQKAAERTLREANESAIQANRAKDRFLAVLGHELRTPLTPVLASVSALLDDPEAGRSDGPGWPAEEVRQAFSMIRRNVELETRLIDDLLDVSRVERGQLRLQIERVDVHTAIRQAVEICRDEIRAGGLDVRVELDAADHHVEADHARLMQIAWNLIHNAAKFSEPGDRLTIRTSNPPPDGPEAGPSRLVVEFQDTGARSPRSTCARAVGPRGWSSSSRTRGPASSPRSSRGSSPRSSRGTRGPGAVSAGSGSAWRSAGRWPRRTGAGSRPRAPAAASARPSASSSRR